MGGWFDLRPPRGGIAFMAVCFMIAGVYFCFRDGGSWYTRAVCPWFAVIGAGLWLKHSWARWVMFAFFVLAAVLATLLVFVKGLSGRWIVQGIVIAGAIVALWQWDVYPPQEVADPDVTDDSYGFERENEDR